MYTINTLGLWVVVWVTMPQVTGLMVTYLPPMLWLRIHNCFMMTFVSGISLSINTVTFSKMGIFHTSFSSYFKSSVTVPNGDTWGNCTVQPKPDSEISASLSLPLYLFIPFSHFSPSFPRLLSLCSLHSLFFAL